MSHERSDIPFAKLFFVLFCIQQSLSPPDLFVHDLAEVVGFSTIAFLLQVPCPPSWASSFTRKRSQGCR